jgi:MFS family permease
MPNFVPAQEAGAQLPNPAPNQLDEKIVFRNGHSDITAASLPSVSTGLSLNNDRLDELKTSEASHSLENFSSADPLKSPDAEESLRPVLMDTSDSISPLMPAHVDPLAASKASVPQTASLETTGNDDTTSPFVDGAIDSMESFPLIKNGEDQNIDSIQDIFLPHLTEHSEISPFHSGAQSSSPAKAHGEHGVTNIPLANESYHHSSTDDDDDDSSNDESSYFADPNNLPSPKSGRRFSWSSTASAPQLPIVNLQRQRSYTRETDASLSLSEDSENGEDCDDNMHHSDPGFPSHPRTSSSLVPTHRARNVTDLQTYPIMRMHSVSSLVSTSSHNSSGSDDTSQAELRHATQGNYLTQSSEVSGRTSPTMGEHPRYPQPSPPVIDSLSAANSDFTLSHPQPQFLTAEQWVASMAASGRQRQPTYEAMDIPPASLRSNSSAWSMENHALAYSGDGLTSQGTDNTHTAAPSIPDSNNGGGSSGDGKFAYYPNSNSVASSTGDNARGGYSYGSTQSRAALTNQNSLPSEEDDIEDEHRDGNGFKVYWQRWIMLFYMSSLNLLSDWTCYSVAPIAVMTEEAFGSINPELLVVIFLGANAITTVCEPIILSRLGLRRTVVFGALLLMIGSIIKSGGMPPIIRADIQKGEGEWRVYFGFFLVGLSQPLYQCTPALLSASWFPERERTMATGVALNANQLGIGFAFIFGTLLVANSDDIPNYFGLLSIISTLTFLGTLFQFDDAPPTPPSDTARVMRGTLQTQLPGWGEFVASVQSLGTSTRGLAEAVGRAGVPQRDFKTMDNAPVSSAGTATTTAAARAKAKPLPGSGQRSGRTSSSRKGHRSSNNIVGRQKKVKVSREQLETGILAMGPDAEFHGLKPSPVKWGRVSKDPLTDSGSGDRVFAAPSPMMQGPVGQTNDEVEDNSSDEREDGLSQGGLPYASQDPMHRNSVYPPGGYPVFPPTPYGAPVVNYQYPDYQSYHQYPQPVWDPRFQQYVYPQYGHPQFYPPPNDAFHYGHQQAALPLHPRSTGRASIYPSTPEFMDEGAEPVLTMTPHHLDINIRDDQVILSIRACLRRPGFIHALVAFTVSGIVINTLSTFMDYLVRLNGVGREYTGIVGGSFQFCIMISSLIVGTLTDKTRAYYSVTVAMLVLGAFGLAECGVSLDSNRGSELRYALVIVAVLVGPLQPVSTELGVDVVYPLSENTVLVIQQLFSNLLSALFIPCFKAMKDIGIGSGDHEHPEYTFSFYLLIVLHATATVFFATFNGRYLRYEHELEKRAIEERRVEAKAKAELRAAFVRGEAYSDGLPETQSLMQHPFV